MPKSKPKQTDEPSAEDKRYAIWNLYNEKAKIRDKDLLKDWGYNLNSLLLFAGIFAGVVTSLCVESRQLLDQDPLSVIQQTVLYIAERDRNASTPFPQIPPFTPDPWAVAVNGYFFASLSASILAAIGAVMCQQWVGEYDSGLKAASTPEQRALRRHYRYRGAEQWYMHQLIAALPILLYISVVLLFVGLIVWFQHIDSRLALIPLAGLVIGLAGYLIAAIFTVIFPSAPFRTEMSKFLFRMTRLNHFYLWYTVQSIRILWGPFMKSCRDLITDTGNGLRGFIGRNSEKGARAGGDKVQHSRDTFIVAKALYTREMKTRRTQAYPWIPPGRDHWQSMHARIWERGNVARDHTLHLSALTWLANSMHLSDHSKSDFKLLLTELNKLEEFRLRDWSAYDNDAPWIHIFNLVLASHNPTTVTTGAKSPSDELPTSPLTVVNSLTRPLSFDVGSAEPFSSSSRVDINLDVPSTTQDLEMIPTLVKLLRKMSDHPHLFERMISEMSNTLIVAFMKHLASHRPTTKEQAKSRLKSITALFSSKRWQRLADNVQPVYPSFKAILDCFKVGDMENYEKSTTWLFTLCSVDEEYDNDEAQSNVHVPWPNPEFISVISYALKSDNLRRRSIRYYINYLDALLTDSDLPMTENRTWRWHRVNKAPQDGGGQIAMLQILAEYLLQPLVTVEDYVERDDNRKFWGNYTTTIKNPALRLIVQAVSGGEIDEVPPDNDPKWQDELWLYAATVSVRLNGREARSYDVSGVVTSTARVMAGIINANKPVPNAMLQDLITNNIDRMNSEHWIAIMAALLKRKDTSELERFASWMIDLAPAEWLTVFTHFFESQPSTSECDVVEILLDTLLDNLPHRLAQKRWHAAVERIVQKGHIEESPRLILDIVLLRHRNPQPDNAPLVSSPLLGILDKMQEELVDGVEKAERSRVKPYVRIMNDLTRRYDLKGSADEGFLARFIRIAEELTQITTTFGDTTEVDNLAEPGTLSPLQELLQRVSALKDAQALQFLNRSPTWYDPISRLYNQVVENPDHP